MSDNEPLGSQITDAERAALIDFLEETKKLVAWVINDTRSALPKYLKQPLVDAWAITSQRFEPIQKQINSQNLDLELQNHGLTGDELRAKLVAFHAYFEAWSTLRDKPKHWWSRTGKGHTKELVTGGSEQ
jgi:hypothetical protein